MQTSFPQSNNKYLKAEDFQEKIVALTFKGWEKKANQDDEPNKKNPRSWQQKVKYVLRYSFPEWAIDPTTGMQMIGNDGQPFRNRYWDPAFPHGYTIVYYFEEGQLESGSKPLFESFCSLQPKVGERIEILRTGTDKETKWKVKRILNSVHPEDIPEIDFSSPEFSGDPEENPNVI